VDTADYWKALQAAMREGRARATFEKLPGAIPLTGQDSLSIRAGDEETRVGRPVHACDVFLLYLHSVLSVRRLIMGTLRSHWLAACGLLYLLGYNLSIASRWDSSPLRASRPSSVW